MKKKYIVFFPLAELVLMFWAPVAIRAGEEQKEPDFSQLFDKTDAMVPMRDGVKLHTEVYVPKNAAQPLPMIFERTPYGVPDDEKGMTYKLRIYQELIDEGYIFVFQDIRGRYKSEGQFVMFRDPRDKHDSKAIDEGTDTYDTIDWLLKNIPHNNGRVGILGISYGGWLTTMALLEPHPALKAASEQASPADQFLGDDFHHNGAFRLSYGFEYASGMETGKENYSFKFDEFDTFDWYLRLGALSNANDKYLHGRVPTWNDFVAHPNYDEFWQKQAFIPYLKSLELKVPNLNVTGWWDQEDFYGPNKIYELLEKNDSRHFNYLAAGPWNHGGWAHGGGRSLGKIDFGSDTAKYFRQHIQAPWFAYWLKDKGSLPAEAVTFETGSNQWKSYDQWPPQKNVTRRKLYLRASAKVSFDPPIETGKNIFDAYLSDPAHPVPYRHRPIGRTYGVPGWGTWLVEDQRFVHLRPDVLSWASEPLQAEVTVTGDVTAHIFASTTGSDSDWIVKLIDVYPEETAKDEDPTMGGYQLMIADEVFRARFRKSFERPEPLVPNQVTPYNFDLHTTDHCFLKGHKIMVQIQSTWFPVIDRNPQKYVPNICKAKEADYQETKQRIFHSARYPSSVEIPVKAE